jgi:Fic family protein/DNA-binding XRE family transcriptional regulator
MKTLIKKAREQKGLKTRELAQLLGIDQALISKFESGRRKPTKEQVVKMASLLEIDFETLMVAWLKEKIVHEIGQDEFALKALQLAEEEIRHLTKRTSNTLPTNLADILSQIDLLKAKLDSLPQFKGYRISQSLELQYTFESNRIEGNSLTLHETDLVINKGLTIAGKSMREHLEAINHQEAIGCIKELMIKKTSLIESDLLAIHNLILRGIQPEDAGRYRKVPIEIKGSSSIPPQPYLIAKEMDNYFIWYKANKDKVHPLILAAEMHERLFNIHPFIDGNGRTSRLIMNLILLQHGYVIANIKGDFETKIRYYETLQIAQTQNNKEDFILFIAQVEKESLERYLTSSSQ